MTIDLGSPPGLDLDRLAGFLDRECPGLINGPLQAEVFDGGKSNITYRVTDGRGQWVVRRPPLGHVLATAHDMMREHRVIAALAPTPVPVPGILALCSDPEVIGAPFYVMELMQGIPYRLCEQLEPLGRGRVRAISTRMVEVLADLHAVDPGEVGLGDFGRPEGFLPRQVQRWKKQLDASKSRELPGVDELFDILVSSVPPDRAPAIVHGDFRLDNLLIDETDAVTAVLDWRWRPLAMPSPTWPSCSPTTECPGWKPARSSRTPLMPRASSRRMRSLKPTHEGVETILST